MEKFISIDVRIKKMRTHDSSMVYKCELSFFVSQAGKKVTRRTCKIKMLFRNLLVFSISLQCSSAFWPFSESSDAVEGKTFICEITQYLKLDQKEGKKALGETWSEKSYEVMIDSMCDHVTC